MSGRKSDIRDNTGAASDKRVFTGIRWALVLYDVILYTFLGSLFVILSISHLGGSGSIGKLLLFTGISMVIVITCRGFVSIYRQVWRFGGIQSYIRMLISDFIAFLIILPVSKIKAFGFNIPFSYLTALCSIQLLFALAIRMFYRYAYKCGGGDKPLGKALAVIFRMFSGTELDTVADARDTAVYEKKEKINVAIFGAGRTGVSLGEELMSNQHTNYSPVVFVDISASKIGRSIYNIPIISQEKATNEYLHSLNVSEIVFAIPTLGVEEQNLLYNYYKSGGFTMKVYDFPIMGDHENDSKEKDDSSKRRIRDFEVEDLLFRKPIQISNEKTLAFYKGKTVLITGGGGSIGSELCRQIARMEPAKIVIVDVYENGAYDVQQELRVKYGDALNLQIEIISVCNMEALDRVFAAHRPDIVLHAAAHKHVPLMEHNCCEAVENNVFGTLNVVLCSEKYKVKRFMMVSTDKAVNPTNVMGATKRMCEMIVQSHSYSGSETTFSATRFGNVLGSAGSVIPLFKRQIQKGGPVTITDPRIIRYFMTIPEASQLVLQSGSMAQNGELFVLNMGQPVKILDLAENMIRLSGFEPYKDIDIVITGLRPGEKLFEELLIKTEELRATDNSLIFVEKDTPLPLSVVENKLRVLREAVATGSDLNVKEALKAVVPTYVSPEKVNSAAAESYEMQHARVIR